MKFKDQVIVVTGGTRGIGAALSHGFLQEGGTVIATHAGNVEAAKTFRQAESQYIDRLHIHAFNVADAKEVGSFFSEFDSRFQRLDVLVNNAGIRRDQIVGMLSEEDWDAVVDVNLKGTFLMAKEAVKRMSPARYGRIINVISPSARLGFAGQGNYAASKAGQQGLARALAKEVGKRNITVNCLSPGFINTDLIKDLKDDMREQYKRLVPNARFGEPEEVAAAGLFLASREASYVNGATLEVNGGL